MGLTNDIVQFSTRLKGSDLSEPVRDMLGRALVNGVGCLVSGATHDMHERAREALLPHAGAPLATLFGTTLRCDALTAAMLNGLSGAAYSFDDTYGHAMLHPSVPVLSGMFACAEGKPVSGAAFMVAYAAALEVSCRLTKALTVDPADPEMAWSQTGIAAGVGTALGCAKLLGLDETATEWALGHAASEASGVRATHGSMAASMIYGHAAQAGLRAALLAQAGFTATPGALEHHFGYLHVLSRAANPPALTDGLGVRYELLSLTFKPYPCGIVIHAAVDAMLKARAEGGFDAGDIAGIDVTVSSRTMTLSDRPDPKTDIEAKVSLQHWVAVAAARGRAGVAEGRMDVVRAEDIAKLRASVRAVVDDTLAPSAARVVVTLTSGKTWAAVVDAAVGSAEAPMSADDIAEKCRQQVEMVLGAERALDLIALCNDMASLDDAAQVARAAA